MFCQTSSVDIGALPARLFGEITNHVVEDFLLAGLKVDRRQLTQVAIDRRSLFHSQASRSPIPFAIDECLRALRAVVAVVLKLTGTASPDVGPWAQPDG